MWCAEKRGRTICPMSPASERVFPSAGGQAGEICEGPLLLRPLDRPIEGAAVGRIGDRFSLVIGRSTRDEGRKEGRKMGVLIRHQGRKERRRGGPNLRHGRPSLSLSLFLPIGRTGKTMPHVATGCLPAFQPRPRPVRPAEDFRPILDVKRA